MDTVQLLFRTRTAKNDEELLDKVQSYLAALLKRYIVFQVLPYTLALGPEVWRVLSKCHDMRNRTEYEGALDVDERLVTDLIGACRRVSRRQSRGDKLHGRIGSIACAGDGRHCPLVQYDGTNSTERLAGSFHYPAR